MAPASHNDAATDALIRDVLNPLPESVRRELGAWMDRARASTAAEVERDLRLEAQAAREAFRDAAAVVERLITE